MGTQIYTTLIIGWVIIFHKTILIPNLIFDLENREKFSAEQQ
jgi:hypothetical protein